MVKRESEGPDGEVVLRLTPVEQEALRSALPEWIEGQEKWIEQFQNQVDEYCAEYDEVMTHGDEYAMIDAAALLHAGQRILESLEGQKEENDAKQN